MNSNRYRGIRLGNSIIEEIVACLLGGYGTLTEMGLLAFERLRDQNQIKPKAKLAEWRKSLATPFILIAVI